MAQQWHEAYSLNHPVLDAQHKKLFSLANRVEALDSKTTTKQEISELIKEFFNYMREHFKDEEAYMQSIDYPHMNEHRILHEKIILNMTSLLQEIKSIEVLQTRMKIVSHEWLVGHILEHDLAIKRWQNQNSIDLDSLDYL